MSYALRNKNNLQVKFARQIKCIPRQFQGDAQLWIANGVVVKIHPKVKILILITGFFYI